jgi:hypothetical protein
MQGRLPRVEDLQLPRKLETRTHIPDIFHHLVLLKETLLEADSASEHCLSLTKTRQQKSPVHVLV